MWKSLDQIVPYIGKQHQIIPEQTEEEGVREINVQTIKKNGPVNLVTCFLRKVPI